MAPGSATPWRRFAVLGMGCAALYAAIVGVVAGVVPVPFGAPPVSVSVWNILALALPAGLIGPLAATYLVPWPVACRVGGRASVGGILSYLGAACPGCQQLVVAALGTTATADYFRPLQPVLAAVSVVMLGLALRARFRARGRGATARSRESAAPVPGAAVADRQG